MLGWGHPLVCSGRVVEMQEDFPSFGGQQASLLSSGCPLVVVFYQVT